MLMRDTNGLMYSLFSAIEGYWGFTHEARARDAGIFGRPVEHLELLAATMRRAETRHLAQRVPEFKYKLFSNIPLDAVYIMPNFFGTAEAALGLEAYAIRAVPFRANRVGRRVRPRPETSRIARKEHKWQRPPQTPERACRLNLWKRMGSGTASDGDACERIGAWTTMTFDELYALGQHSKYLHARTCGPINIYEPDSSRLFLAYMISYREYHARDFHRRTIPKTVYLAAASHLGDITDPKIKQSMRNKLEWILRRYGCRASKIFHKIEEFPGVHIREIKSEVVKSIGKFEHPLVATFMGNQLNPISGRTPTIHSAGRTHRKYTKQFDISSIAHINEAQRERYLSGESMRILPINADVPPPDVDAAARTVDQIKSTIVRVCFAICARHLIPQVCRTVLGPIRRHVHEYQKTHTPHPDLVSIWAQAAPGTDERGAERILGGVDRNPRALILLDDGCLGVWLHHTYWKDTEHIEFTPELTPDDMIRQLYDLRKELLPARFLKTRLALWSSKMIYGYINLKAKCFEDGRRTCTKPGHVCVRRVSANLLPTKTGERCAARALDAIGRDEQGPGTHLPALHYQVYSCDEFVKALSSAFQNLILVPAFLSTCIQCEGHKPPISIAHGDSSQMYDEVDEDECLTIHDENTVRGLRRGRPNTVSTARGKKCRTFMGGAVDPKKRPHDMEVLTRAEIRRWMTYSKCSVSRIGRHVFKRKRGVTMGGSSSPAKAGLLYRNRERRFLKSRRSWYRCGMGALARFPPPGPISRIFPTIRIADDDISLSAVHCPTCLGSLGSKVYHAPLKHSCEECGVCVGVIDIVADVSGLVLQIARANRNMEFIVRATPFQTRIRHLPSLPAPITTRKLRTSWLAGSLALDAARNPSFPHRIVMGAFACAELMRLQHSPAQLSQALRCIRHPSHQPLAQLLAKMCQILGKAVSPPRYEQFIRYIFAFILPWAAAARMPILWPGAH